MLGEVAQIFWKERTSLKDAIDRTIWSCIILLDSAIPIVADCFVKTFSLEAPPTIVFAVVKQTWAAYHNRENFDNKKHDLPTVQEISNRTFLTDPPKSLKMGSRARARRFQLQKGLATARARANPKRGSV